LSLSDAARQRFPHLHHLSLVDSGLSVDRLRRLHLSVLVGSDPTTGSLKSTIHHPFNHEPTGEGLRTSTTEPADLFDQPDGELTTSFKAVLHMAQCCRHRHRVSTSTQSTRNTTYCVCVLGLFSQPRASRGPATRSIHVGHMPMSPRCTPSEQRLRPARRGSMRRHGFFSTPAWARRNGTRPCDLHQTWSMSCGPRRGPLAESRSCGRRACAAVRAAWLTQVGCDGGIHGCLRGCWGASQAVALEW
jgi:hypothetical protein